MRPEIVWLCERPEGLEEYLRLIATNEPMTVFAASKTERGMAHYLGPDYGDGQVYVVKKDDGKWEAF